MPSATLIFLLIGIGFVLGFIIARLHAEIQIQALQRRIQQLQKQCWGNKTHKPVVSVKDLGDGFYSAKYKDN